MRTVIAAGLLAAVVGGAGRAQTPAAGPPDGFYKAESVQYDGKEQLADPKSREPLNLVLAGGEYRMFYVTDAKAGKAFRLFTGDFKPDPAAGTFEMTVKDGQKKGLKVHGIYQVTGSNLRICYGPADKPRPGAFAAPAGTGIFFETWSYMNPQPKAAN